MTTQAPEIDGVTLINDFEDSEPVPGQIRTLRITEAHDYDVVGTLLSAPEAERNAKPVSGAMLINISPAPAQAPEAFAG
jgi:ribosomal protein S12 methylthiotransferase